MFMFLLTCSGDSKGGIFVAGFRIPPRQILADYSFKPEY